MNYLKEVLISKVIVNNRLIRIIEVPALREFQAIASNGNCLARSFSAESAKMGAISILEEGEEYSRQMEEMNPY